MEGSHMIMDNVTLSNSSQFNTTIQEHEHEHEGIHLIGWIFDYVAHPLLISVFLIVAAMLKIGDSLYFALFIFFGTCRSVTHSGWKQSKWTVQDDRLAEFEHT